ncbi:MAG: DegT/DnrJ/EryC1/StrS family aminotransferase [Bacteroidales bacterium]|jgi:dTDP-4-amino-4,6-dideoxygalactose transaminase|nr:DegT/DnrJ/EryC1/StrS family aminotransferase [Bacteroidales bacterium]
MIPFMDIKRQYELYKDEFHKAIENVCADTAFSGGKYVESFEKKFAQYCDIPHAAAVNSGTSALHLAMLVLGIGPDDEVIVPANTFIASAWGVTYVGATPVFVDCDKKTWEIDVSSAEKAITKKTKAIIGVHLYGQPCNIDGLKAIVDNYGIKLIEDCAQAHGAMYKGKRVGGFGDLGCFSFYPGKNLGAFGEGGAIVSNNEDHVKHINSLKNHGMAIRYYHDEVGFNMRMEGIQGAILELKLKYIDKWNKQRQETANKYRQYIKNPAVLMQLPINNTTSVYHLFVVAVEKREVFISYLNENNIQCGLHYPVPCHLQKAYLNLGYKKGSILNAEWLSKRCVSLPMFPELTDEEIDHIIDIVNKYKG